VIRHGQMDRFMRDEVAKDKIGRHD
jgi:hypothetical protein